MNHGTLRFVGLGIVGGSAVAPIVTALIGGAEALDVSQIYLGILTGWVVYFGATIADRLTPKAQKVEYHINANANAAEAIDAVVADTRKRQGHDHRNL